MRMVMMAVVMTKHHEKKGKVGLALSQTLCFSPPSQISDQANLKFESPAAECAVDMIAASLYYQPIMLASRQTNTVCCCTCCRTTVSSGIGRLLT
jgi:hypothetical protein